MKTIDMIQELVDEFNSGSDSSEIDAVLNSGYVQLIESDRNSFAHFSIGPDEYQITWHSNHTATLSPYVVDE